MGAVEHPEQVIALHGPPRSGTSWLAQILDSSPDVAYKYQPLYSRSFRDRIGARSEKASIEAFFKELFHRTDDFLDRENLKKKGAYPRFAKDKERVLCMKHVRYHYLIPRFLELFEGEGLMVLGIIRHPCGYLNSWRKAPREFLPEWDFEKEWRFAPRYNLFRPEEYYGFHRWKEIAELFLVMKEWYPDQFDYIHYEDLVRDPIAISEGVFEWVGLPMSEQSRTFIERSTQEAHDNEYSVFKGGKDPADWKGEFPARIADEVLRELAGSEFERFLKE